MWKIRLLVWTAIAIFVSTPSSNAAEPDAVEPLMFSTPIRVPFDLMQVRGQELYCGNSLYMLSDDYKFNIYTDLQGLLDPNRVRIEDFASSFTKMSPVPAAYMSLVRITDFCYPHSSLIIPGDLFFTIYNERLATNSIEWGDQSLGLVSDETSFVHLVRHGQGLSLEVFSPSGELTLPVSLNAPVFRHAFDPCGPPRIDPRFAITPEQVAQGLAMHDLNSKVFVHRGVPCIYNYASDTLQVFDTARDAGYLDVVLHETFIQAAGEDEKDQLVECAICSDGKEIVFLTHHEDPDLWQRKYQEIPITKVWSLATEAAAPEARLLSDGPAVTVPVQMEFFDDALCLLSLALRPTLVTIRHSVN